ncbi:outer membrane beta barrel protein [Pontixanthobacter gangjinensis]|uniref:Uncharacterized protein n=1 Tax=Christiangramia aestuarii TaxID=1028746 RepID=A0A7M3SXY6_9FLAO|nr:porin [Christiangramia aestuarii]MUP41467.1 hypothetical protein [Christiangramia aestuarii]
MTQKLQYKKFLIPLFLFIILGPLKVSAQEKPSLDIGGALRFNYNLSSWKDAQKDRGGDFGYDMFRINVNGTYGDFYIDAEYRWYSEAFGGSFLKQAWVGYRFDEKNELQVGLSQVPFGIQQYNSNNWFFNLTYYMGLEDDHDMGVKFLHEGEKFEYDIAFYKNAEELRFGNTTEASSSRYSYDVVGRNKEANQVNGKIIYKIGEDFKHRFGASAQFGGLYNLDTEKMGTHSGLALHYEFFVKNWNLKLQAMKIDHDPENAEGETNEIIQMGAYGAPYAVASDFNIYTLAISKSVPVKLGPVSNLEFYNDFGFMDKDVDSFEDSFMNVTGVLVTAGKLYTYIDYAAGYNQSWLGGNFVDDFAEGNPNAKWEARFNINIGYYF